MFWVLKEPLAGTLQPLVRKHGRNAPGEGMLMPGPATTNKTGQGKVGRGMQLTQGPSLHGQGFHLADRTPQAR